MRKFIIPRKEFCREFEKHTKKHPNLKRMFELELKVEPAQGIVTVEGVKLADFREMLRILSYSTNPKLVGKRGEDAVAVKDYGELVLDYRWLYFDYNDPNLGMLGDKRRHLKIWDMADNFNFIFTTAHNEDAPSMLLLEPVTTVYYHLFTKGMGDYESGTRDFFTELGKIIP